MEEEKLVKMYLLDITVTKLLINKEGIVKDTNKIFDVSGKRLTFAETDVLANFLVEQKIS